jgi:hypothetical protein
MADEIQLVEVLFGPHAGCILRMSPADATQAETDHWAIPVRYPPFDQSAPPAHAPLTPEERTAAEQAAVAWADAQSQPQEAPPPEGEHKARAMRAESNKPYKNK